MIQRVAYLCLQATREGQASYAHVNEIIEGLRRRGVTVDLYEPPFAKREKSPGIPVRLWGFLWVQLRLLARIRRYDAIYMRGHFMSILASLGAKLFRVPQVHEVNGPYADIFAMYPWTRPMGGLFIWLSRTQHRLADAIITVTPQMAAWCAEDSGNSKVHVVPNGANLDLFRPGLRHPDAPEGRYAIFFGAFSPWQGIETMLQAVRLPQWPKDVKLVLAGDGMERARVEATARESDRVLYIGTKNYRDLAGFVAPASVGLCAKSDGGSHASTGWSPLKLYEMMATGIPVVVTDLPGQFEIVEASRAGLVIKPGDPLALAQAVAQLAQDPVAAKEMGERGHAAVSREHSWDRRAQDTLQILLGTQKGAA